MRNEGRLFHRGGGALRNERSQNFILEISEGGQRNRQSGEPRDRGVIK